MSITVRAHGAGSLRRAILAVGTSVLARTVLVLGLALPLQQAHASTRNVDINDGACDDGTGVPVYCHIQAAVTAAVDDDTINVAAGTYAENVALNKRLTMNGAQAGATACARVATESVVAGAGPTLFALQVGSAGSTIDGFTFSGGVTGIESTGGPIDNVQLLNNRIVGFTGNGMFINDSGVDLTLSRNEVNGSSQTGNGSLVHFDQDNFDGLHFTDNCIRNGVNGTGVFVDGNHNIGVSASRPPLFSGNLIDGMANNAGVNLGRFAFEFGTISNNTFSNNAFDGLQGGIQNSTITMNKFVGNGRHGLALTGFGGAGDATRGAQNNTVTNNCFIGNGFVNAGAGLFFTSGQFPGTISTNSAHQNNFFGNSVGASYAGTETINIDNNWWGCATGPNTAGCDTTSGATLTTAPFLTTFATPAPCCAEDLNCDDGLGCTGAEACNSTTHMCVAGTPPLCTVGSADPQCNDPVCVEPGVCTVQPKPNGTGCDDGTLCSVPDSCQGGVCTAGIPDTDGDGTCDVDDLDDDGDGVSDAIENLAPNAGDGNDDGILDSLQSNVTSLPSATSAAYITLVSSCPLNWNVQVFEEDALGIDPEYQYPFGLIGFTVGCSPAMIQVIFHEVEELPLHIYRKFGPTPPLFNFPHFYTLPDAPPTNVVFDSVLIGAANAARVSFTLTDGLLGDGTGVDGIIVDPSGPVRLVRSVPLLTGWAWVALLTVLSAVGGFALARRRTSTTV